MLTLLVPVSVLFVITFMTAGVGGSTKKIAFGAAYQLGYTIGNIIGPQTYRESDAPNYYVSVSSSRAVSHIRVDRVYRSQNTPCWPSWFSVFSSLLPLARYTGGGIGAGINRMSLIEEVSLPLWPSLFDYDDTDSASQTAWFIQ
jgi:hypothetical protein